MKPLFSIVIPTFNVEKYIVDCLFSIESQTISKDSYEVVIVDDCSSDTTCIKIKAFLKNSTLESQFHRLPTNQGPGVARNTGVNLAKGEFILFVDADDCISGNCLEEVETIINQSPSDIDAVSFNWSYIGPKIQGDKGFPDRTVTGQRRDLKFAILPTLDRIKSYLRMGMDGSVIYTVTRKSMISRNQILFFPGLHEDIDVIYKIYWHCRNIGGTEKVLYLKRNRIGSIVNTLSEKHVKGYYRAWNEIGNFTRSEDSESQWDDHLNYFLSGLTGAMAVVTLNIFDSFPDDKNSRAKLYKFSYECFLQFYQDFVRGRVLPKETYYDHIAGKFLEIYGDKEIPTNKRGLLDAFIEHKRQELEGTP